MTCPECTAARVNRHHGIYRADCFDCCMRGFARSTFAADAVTSRSTGALRAALERAHPNVPVADSLQCVWRWWRVDHPSAEPEA